MENDGILNLLVAQDTIEDANRLISLLRNTAYKVNARHLGSPTVLADALHERDWDLALISNDNAQVAPRDLFNQLGKLNRDTPVIIITRERSPQLTVAGLRLGAADVIAMDEDQVFLEVVSRTLYHLEQRRRERYWKQRSALAEARCDRFMASSRDAVATIQDGTYVEVNDCYARLFGYPDRDSMILLPVVDSAASTFQNTLKGLLKSSSTKIPENERSHDFTGIGVSGDIFTTPMTISPVQYQDEPALQFLVAAERLPAAGVDSAPELATAGDFSRIDLRKMLDFITLAIRRASHDDTDSLLLYIRIDHFHPLQDDIGLKQAEDLAVAVSQHLSTIISRQHRLGRIREDAFILLMTNTAPEQGLTYALELCRQTADHVFNIGAGTQSLTLSIGIEVIDHKTVSAESCIDHCLQAIESLHRGPAGRAGNSARCHEPTPQPDDGQVGNQQDIATFGKHLIERQLLVLLFQPMVALHGGSAECYEVLVELSPDAPARATDSDFISEISTTDIAAEIDRWIILEAAKSLLKKRKSQPQTRLFVSLSAATLRDTKFIPWLKTVLEAAEIPLGSLSFQLAELDVARNLHRATDLVNELQAMAGLAVLSQFGLATPPLGLLGKVPFDFIKLHQQVIERSQKTEAGKENLKQLLNALKAEEAEIIVPFIETPAMIPSLWQHGVDYIQGHYIQAPSRVMDYDFTDGG